jgi:hypothetical protein
MLDEVTKVEFRGKTYAQQHGNPFDRGSADSYYDRPRNPHKYPFGTYNGDPVMLSEGSADYEAYMAGYDFNEECGDKKDWG